MLLVELADFVDADHAGVLHPGGRPGLFVEAANVLFRGQVAVEDHLHRDDPIQVLLPRLVDNPHAPAAKLLDELVVAEIAGQAENGRPATLAVEWFAKTTWCDTLQNFQAAQRRTQPRMRRENLFPLGTASRLQPLEIFLQGGQFGSLFRRIGHRHPVSLARRWYRVQPHGC